MQNPKGSTENPSLLKTIERLLGRVDGLLNKVSLPILQESPVGPVSPNAKQQPMSQVAVAIEMLESCIYKIDVIDEKLPL